MEDAPEFPADAPNLAPSALVGLVGAGIQKSRTPYMHQREGQRQGLRYIYKLIDTEMMEPAPPPIGEMIAFARRFGFDGLNVTYPFKQSVIAHLDELTAGAEAVGSVNTVRFRNGRAIGHNTDMTGFAECFRRNIAGRRQDTVLQLGAGGAGGAVAAALLESGVGRLLIHDLDASRAEGLATALAGRYGADRVQPAGDAAGAARAAAGIVNATPVGMAKLPGTPIDAGLLTPATWVVDIIYFPIETELMRTARARGCHVVGGRDMAIHQAVFAFEVFTGRKADADAMGRNFDALA